MLLTILGSAAAEAWPALFCTCGHCREARRRGGRNIRRRTSYLLNSDTLIDYGPDINWQSHEFGVDLAAIKQILFTHSHHDHWAPQELTWRYKWFAVLGGGLDLYGNQAVFERLERDCPQPAEELTVTCHLIGAGQAFRAGALEVLPLAAQHATGQEEALNFIVRDGAAGLLIANDTGWWEEPTWELAAGQALDAAVIESTSLFLKPDQRHGHMGAETSLAFRDRLVETGALREGATVILNHFSHHGGALYEELCEHFAPHGVQVGYDGLRLEL
jgi:phosphoribosyl 1,2-cyclic phosphate phosphodiesterase